MAELTARMNALVETMRVLSLGPDRILTLVESDSLVRMNLPFAGSDVVQRQILRAGQFYEARQLAHVRGLIAPGAVVVDAGANIGVKPHQEPPPLRHEDLPPIVLGWTVVVSCAGAAFCRTPLRRFSRRRWLSPRMVATWLW